MSQAAALTDAQILSRDRRVTTLIGVSHGASHFFQLALPPLFVLINASHGISFTELGILTGAFYIASAVCQPPSGFLVDRFGARVVLLGGLGLISASTALIGVLPYYPAMFVLSVLAGAGNSVFHPCDYSIMNATISEGRMARAFSFHMFGGYIGYASAPIAMTVAGTWLGWQAAVVVAGLVGLVLFAVLWGGSRDFRDSTHERAESGAAAPPLAESLRALIAAPIILCWMFFLIVAMGQIGLQTFVPTLFEKIYGFDLKLGGFYVTLMLAFVAIGVLCGGYIADYFRKPDRVVTFGYTTALVAVLAIWRFDLTGSTIPLGPLVPLLGLEFEAVQTGLCICFALIGFMYGVAFPSRELLVRAATPKGASGRVFGFVYSGMDFGSASTPILFGFFVDSGIPRTAFLCVALFWATAIVIMLATNAATQRQSAVAAE